MTKEQQLIDLRSMYQVYMERGQFAMAGWLLEDIKKLEGRL